MTDLEVLSKRLERVERRYRRLQTILMLVCILGAAVGLMGQVRPERPRPPDELPEKQSASTPAAEPEIRTEHLILVDKNKKERASLVSDGAGSVFLVLFDANGKTRAELSVSNYGPSLTFLDPSGQPRAVFGSTTIVGSHVVSESGVAERNPASSIVLFDRIGKLIWRQP